MQMFARMAVLIGALVTCSAGNVRGQEERALGLDISAWQGNISQTTWNNLRNVENRQFVILRSSRGGTTGYYNQNDASNSQGLNTLSQRYDDPYYVQNMNRATAAGMFAGSYHFSRPDIIASTLNSGGIPNSGTDEADHFIQMAGPFMRPGYLMPVHDLEAGDGKRTDDEMAQFCIDFSNRIYDRMGIRCGIYVNGNYAAFVLGTASPSLRSQILTCYPTLWSARWPNQADPDSIDVQNGQPKDSYSSIYGPWDDSGITHPWKFWQYASTGRLQSFSNGGANLDMDVVQGGVDFLKDNLIPAVWMNDGDGEWSTLTNWNSGQTPVAPVTGSGQVAPVGTQTLPTPRLPGAAGSGVTSGQNDTVLLDRPNANITVTLSSGSYNIRKLYMREALNLAGGTLSLNYVPSWDSTTNAAEFSGPVTMSNSATLNVHTLQVDAANTFTIAGGTTKFLALKLMPHSTTPARISFTGNATLNSLSNGIAASITNGAGAGNSGLIDLAGGTRTLTIGNGGGDVDVSIDVAISNGGFTKAGAGTLRLTKANTFSAGTTVSTGRLLVNNATGSGTGSGSVTVNGGTLGGTGTIAGAVILNAAGTLIPGDGTTIGKLTLGNPPTLNGTNFLKIDRNGGAALADKLSVTSGTLNYGGTLVVTNVGAELTGGEVFTNFSAGSYAGSFAATNLPALGAGLNWYLGNLVSNGSIKVNRSPLGTVLTITNTFPNPLQIPVAMVMTGASDPDGDTLTFSSIGTSTNGITLQTNGGFFTYANNANVADRFLVTLDDGHGAVATTVVQIVPSVVGQFLNLQRGDGSSAIHFSGQPGATYFLDRSSNLLIWQTISTNVIPSNGLLDYVDTFGDLGGQPGSVYYRLRQ